MSTSAVSQQVRKLESDGGVTLLHRSTRKLALTEAGRDLWAWIAEGAHIYICGDAKRMAKDVELALAQRLVGALGN